MAVLLVILAVEIRIRLNIHRVAALGVDTLGIDGRLALVRAAVLKALPRVLCAPVVHGRQAEPNIGGVAEAVADPGAPGSAYGDELGVGCALCAWVRAAVAAGAEDAAQGWNRRGEAANARLDVGTEDDVGDPDYG